MTKEDRERIVLATLNNSMQVAKVVGGVNMAHCLIEAGLKLLIDLDGPAGAWAHLRDSLSDATERARQLAHPAPKATD